VEAPDFNINSLEIFIFASSKKKLIRHLCNGDIFLFAEDGDDDAQEHGIYLTANGRRWTL